MSRLLITPTSISKANQYVTENHRHHKAVRGAKFAVAVSVGDEIKGVAIVGRPVARHLDNGWTLEVNRCCTDGTKNACSMLYRAAWRAARAMGYTKLITYTLPYEGGASLRGAGFKLIGEAGGGNWNVPSRPRQNTELTQKKYRWEISEVSNG